MMRRNGHSLHYKCYRVFCPGSMGSFSQGSRHQAFVENKLCLGFREQAEKPLSQGPGMLPGPGINPRT